MRASAGDVLRVVSLAALAAILACETSKTSATDVVPAATATAMVAASAPSIAAEDPSAAVARWEKARSTAVHIPCRAIAVDGPVNQEGAGDAGAALALQGEIPSEFWLSLAHDARLVAKDPRTTRETTFVGPARVRVCVTHREESWLESGHFESAIGAGETPGAEEWVVTPLGVVRYMAAKVAVDVRAKDTAVAVGSGVAFLWLDEGVRVTTRSLADADAGASVDAGAGAGAHLGMKSGEHPGGVDAGAYGGLALDDDGWLRVADGEVRLSAAPPAPAAALARTMVDRCVTLFGRSRELATTLLAGRAAPDGSTAKEQMRTRRVARAACAVAGLRVDALPPSPARSEMSTQLQAASTAWAALPEPSASP